MAEYIEFDVETDPGDLEELAYDFLRAHFADWEPNEGNFDTRAIQAHARIAAEEMDIVVDVPKAIFRYFGSALANLPPVDATFATVASTWTAIDTAGYTITAGTLVGLRAAGDELKVFEVVSDVTILPGASVTTAGEVLLQATEEGSASNALSGDVELVDPLSWVSSIAAVGSSTGGTDAESDDDYLDRLAGLLQVISPRPIIPGDFAVLAREVAGVERAVAVDGYDGATTGNDRTVGVACIDENGAAVGSGVKSLVEAELEAQREVNFVVAVFDPTVNNIDVITEVYPLDGEDTVALQAAVEAAIETYLDPAEWGKGQLGDADRDWNLVTKVRYLEVAQIINAVPGVDYIVSLTVNAGTADVTMTGEAPLPAASPAPTVTVS